MTVQSLNDFAKHMHLDADIAIVGAGACGLTLARALSGSGLNVLVLESGGAGEDDAHEGLNAVDLPEGCFSTAETAQRDAYHRNLTKHWDGARQGYGVRCRGLGGSTQAWAGKSAPFEDIDFAERPWLPLSGWPIPREVLWPYIEAAEDLLNLGPGSYDAELWNRIGRTPPEPPFRQSAFRPIFWKFARSRRSLTDIMRMGEDFMAEPATDVRVLLHATATRITTTEDGRRATGLEVRSLSGNRATVQARRVVLASSGIENPRLLLMSDQADARGLGNQHDCVGRYLVDHPTATIARFDAVHANDMAARFGLYGFRDGGRTHVYMHGLALHPDWQRAEQALNGAIFVTEERSPDDPFTALKRLVKRSGESSAKDALTVLRSPVRLVRGFGARAIGRGLVPRPIARRLVNFSLRYFPNTLARDFQTGSLPVKLDALRVEAATEQPPLPENRVTLSDRVDPLGLPLPKVTWTAGQEARVNLLRIGQAFEAAMDAPGLPRPTPEAWVRDARPEDAVAIDVGHTMGGTRMSNSPETGVVDPDCKVHGVDGLFVAGGSVMPTSGYANPTLMMIALTLRLADHLKKMPRG